MNAAAAEPALAVEGLAKTFPGAARPVWREVSFSVPSGQSVAILGGNGTGKSTLLRCCLRLIEPDVGAIRINGRALSGARGGALRRLRARVGFVFQKHHLVPRASVLTYVMHGALGRGRGVRSWSHSLADAAERDLAMDCLAQVGLADLAARRADRLSGGQSQRVAIARALMQKPDMILADEPTASLDPQAGEEVMDMFVRLVRARGLTLVFVSHHLDHAIAYADRILALKDGGLFLDAPAREETAARLRELYV
jgi:phosphonate transport system ATP-binding protein